MPGGLVVAEQSGNLGCLAVGAQVVGRAVGHGSAAIVEAVAGPDAAVGVVETVVVGVKDTLLPVEMPLDGRPELAGLLQVARPVEVPQQRVDIDEVHVVVVDLLRVVGVAGNVARCEHGVARLLGGAGEVLLRVEHGDALVHFHVDKLRGRITGKVSVLPVVPSEHVARIAGTPTGQRHTPADGSVLPHAALLVPDAVGGGGDDIFERVDERVGRLEFVVRHDAGGAILAFHEHGLQVAARVGIVADGHNRGLVEGNPGGHVVDRLAGRGAGFGHLQRHMGRHLAQQLPLAALAALAVVDDERRALHGVDIAAAFVERKGEAIRLVDAQVAVAAERGIGGGAVAHRERHALAHISSAYFPNRTRAGHLQGIGRDEDECLLVGVGAARVGQRDAVVAAHAVISGADAGVGDVEGHVAAHVRHVEAELGHVGGLESGSVAPSVERACELVLAVNAHDAVLLGPVLHGAGSKQTGESRGFVGGKELLALGGRGHVLLRLCGRGGKKE